MMSETMDYEETPESLIEGGEQSSDAVQPNTRGLLQVTAQAIQRRRLFLEAQQQQRKLQQAQKEMEKGEQSSSSSSKLLRRGFQRVGTALQKMNVGRWIDQLERDQELADDLEFINQENKQTIQSKGLARQAQEACTDAMQQHLTSFLEEHPTAPFEAWIAELHPDNVLEDKEGTTECSNATGLPRIDHRFYVTNCLHQRLWQDMHPQATSEELAQEGFFAPVIITEEDADAKVTRTIDSHLLSDSTSLPS